MFEGRDIPAGAERTLAAGASSSLAAARGRPSAEHIQRSYGFGWLGGFRSCMDSKTPADMLSRSSYVAYLDKSPFVESPLAGVESEDTAAIVYGISKGQNDGR